MSKSLFFNKLFKPGEGLCVGSFKAVSVFSQLPDSGNFFCINPLSLEMDYGYADKDYYKKDVPRRADVNISAYRNFMFEMDSIDLESQLTILKNCGIEFTSIVYSGGKSYHAILGLSEAIEADYHSDEASLYYKSIWQRLRAKIDRSARMAGFEYPKGKDSFIDSSCQNPSRLSRVPEAVRDNGNVQELIELNNTMSLDAFVELLDSCPMIFKSEIVNTKLSELDISNANQFWRYCPIGLKNKLRYVDWACSEGMYPELLKLTYWAIDSTGVDKDTFLEVLWERTFPKLLEAGYPKRKLNIAINDAYNGKRRK